MSTFIDKKTGLELTDDGSGCGSDVISLMITIDDEIISDADKLAYSFPLDEKREMKFGIVKINTHVSPKLHKTLFFLFTVDCSGSMSDLCKDKRTKNAHIIHTLTNMLRFFSEKEKENIFIYVQVDAFDDKISSIIKPVLVSPANVADLIDLLKKIYPRNSTNIELALINASAQIDAADSFVVLTSAEEGTGAALPDKYHIFMTDGDITSGNSCEKHLKTLLNPQATNIFIGFGIDHNIKVLSELGGGNDTSSSVNNYYFIDVLENSGLVYGEIIHNILQVSLKHVDLFLVNGLIYNWKTNAWTNTMNIGNLIFGTEKVFHIVSFQEPIVITSSGFVEDACAGCSKPFYCTQYKCEPVCESESITKYKYRQRTQQLLFLARHFDDYKNVDGENGVNQVKKKLGDFFNELKDAALGLMDDGDKPFIKLLMDDVYVTLKMFGTSYNSLYSNARQTSQGTQRCYNVGTGLELRGASLNASLNPVPIPRDCGKRFLTRQITQHINNVDLDSIGTGAGAGAWTRVPQTSPTQTQHYDALGDQESDQDSVPELDNEYEISQNVDTPYSTPALLGIMREISAPIGRRRFFNNDDENDGDFLNNGVLNYQSKHI